jgi:hypothetical protein
VPQWYHAAAGPATATVVTVRADQNTPNINATLAADGGMSGTVTAAAGGTPLAGVCVRAVPRAAGRGASFAVSAAGSYSFAGLIPGTYTVQFSSGCGASGYARQWWDGAASAATATIIDVKASAITTGINAELHK